MPTTPWGEAALQGELEAIERITPGHRDDGLNKHAYKIGQIIGKREVDEDDARARIIKITDPWIGVLGKDGKPFTKHQRDTKIARGFAEGKLNPRGPAPRSEPFRDPWFEQPGRDDGAPAPTTPAPTPKRDIELSTGLPEAFWTARPVLGHIRQAAWSRGRSAEAVLGAVLARVAADTLHSVKLPAIVGNEVGLSLIVALTGRSGTGKTSSKGIARRLVRRRILDEKCDDVPPGSGEGLIELLFEFEKDDEGNRRKVLKHHNAFVYVDEGEVLAIQARRNSSNTILPILRAAFTDAVLGQVNATSDRKRRVPEGHYVYGVVLGIQPAKAVELLDDAGGGTPQRFLWIPTDTPIPAPGDRPPWPGELDRPKIMPRSPVSGYTFAVDDAVAAEVMANDHQRQQQGCDPLDEHADLIRLKVSAVLAVMDGRLDLSLKDWQLAGLVIDLSRRTRNRVVATIEQHRRDANVNRGKAEGARQIARDETVAEVGVREACRAIRRKLDRVGDWVNSGDLRDVCGRYRDYFEAAVEQLRGTGEVEAEETPRTTRYRRVERATS